MANEHLQTDRGVFIGRVSYNRQIGQRFYHLGLEFSDAAAEAFAQARPGQFAQIDLANAALPSVEKIPQDLAGGCERKVLLRRPFSFCDVISGDNKTAIDILYCALGPASLRMTKLAAGDSVSVIGPLGNGFRLPVDKKLVLLVIGGMGAGPLIHLTKVITAQYPATEIVAFAGAKTAKALPFKHKLDDVSDGLGFPLAEFATYAVKSMIATDDGSAGYHGLVIDCFSQWLEQCETPAKHMIIYTCGPEMMLKRLSEIAAERSIDCQLSMERRMACGIGLCQSCVVECKLNDSEETIYRLCCEDGPVFESDEVVFSD